MIKQSITAAGKCGRRSYLSHGRQEAETEEGTGNQVKPSVTNQ
jgi:hypothetical protein